MPKRKPASKETLDRSELLLVRLAFIGAFGISAFLAWNSLQGGGVPGCGPESDCDKVLSSRWSFLFGLPVSLFALPVYLAAIVLLFQKTIRWKTLLPVALIVLGAALWFVGLQAFALRAFCKFCMAAHIAGGLAALFLLRNNPLPANLTARFLGLAAAPVALLVIAQLNSTPPGPLQVVSNPPPAQTNSSPAASIVSVPPDATNVAFQVAAKPDPTFSFVDGEFTLKGVTKPVTLELEFNGVNPGMGHGEVAGFEASVVLNRKDFGIDIDMPLETGGTVVGDKITVTLEIEAVRQA